MALPPCALDVRTLPTGITRIARVHRPGYYTLEARIASAQPCAGGYPTARMRPRYAGCDGAMSSSKQLPRRWMLNLAIGSITPAHQPTPGLTTGYMTSRLVVTTSRAQRTGADATTDLVVRGRVAAGHRVLAADRDDPLAGVQVPLMNDVPLAHTKP